MKNTVTAKGFKRLNDKLNIVINELKLIRMEKAHAYHASGDGWHDNPGWIQIGQIEDRLVNEINELQKYLNNLRIVDTDSLNKNIVTIGSTVTFEMTGKESKIHKMTIGGEGETDIKNNVISINSPIGNALNGMKAGDSKKIIINSLQTSITIKKIEFDNV